MNLDKITNVASAIVGLAIVTVLVTSKNTASVVRAVGESFSGSIRAASGR